VSGVCGSQAGRRLKPESPRSQAKRINELPTRADQVAAIAAVEPVSFQGMVKTHLNIWREWRVYNRKVQAREASQ